MIITLGIPVLNRGDFLLRCVTSVDHPVENLVIINNSEGKNAQVTAACSQIERREIQNASLFDNIKIETKKEKQPRRLYNVKQWRHRRKQSS